MLRTNARALLSFLWPFTPRLVGFLTRLPPLTLSDLHASPRSQGDMYNMYLLREAVKVTPIPLAIILTNIWDLSDVPVNCGTDHRFRTRADLGRVMRCLRLPPMIQLLNGQWIQRERAFLYFIRRMASVMTVNQLITIGFGGDPPLWRRVLDSMAKHIADTLGFKLDPANIGFFSNRFNLYSEAIRNKVNV